MTWKTVPKYCDGLVSSSKKLPSSALVKEDGDLRGRSIKHLDEDRLSAVMFILNAVVVCAAIACCFFKDSIIQK